MTATEPGNQRGEATRRRILDAAEQEFATHGIGLTLDEVARRAGTTRMTVHRHTGGREQLVRHLVLRASARLGHDLTCILGGREPFRERLTDAMVVTVEAIRATPSLSALLTDPGILQDWGLIDPDDEVGGQVQGFLLHQLERAADEGLLRVDAAAATEWILAQIRLVLVLPWVAGDGDALRRWFGGLVLDAVLADVVPAA